MAKLATSQPAATQPVLALKGVSCRFGLVTALNSVSLSVMPGEQVALVGPSGAGKSTLLSLLNGSQNPTTGEVTVLGRSLPILKGRRRRQLQQQIGTVYQQHQLIDNLRVIHNVNAGHLGRWSVWRALWSLIWPQQIEVARRALEALGVGDKLYARTDRLSGGQQQRVALARVLVQDPTIVLADEPVASVDPARAHDMMGLLCAMAGNLAAAHQTTPQKRQRRTLVVSLHTVELAKAYCDRIIGLRQGRIVFDEPTATVSDQQLADLYDLQT
ncbi:MAG: phosphonate ABC transporter ATP-binding protein [Cyanobacteria bacterium J06560_2]